MNDLKTILLILSLFTAPLTQAVTPAQSPAVKPQIAGYYHYNFSGIQITALLDGTNYLSPSLFKGLTAEESNAILKKYYAVDENGLT